MSEWYAYIAKNGRLIVRKSRGPAELQESLRNMKHYIALFGAEDADAARQTAEELRDEWEWKQTNNFAKGIINKTVGGQL